MIANIISSLEAMSQALRRGTAVNVNDQPTKDHAIGLAQKYFTDARVQIVQNLGEFEGLLQHDQIWQQLVRLAHGNNARKSYQRIISQLRKGLAEFNVRLLTTRGIETESALALGKMSTEEALLLETLEGLVPSAAASYRQGLNDLRQATRLSYRGTATEFREALRETLDHLAPDNQVTRQDGFKFEGDQKKPTTKQKVRYVMASRGRNKTQRETAEKSLSLVDELAGEVTRATYNHASLAAHVQQSRKEVLQIKRYVDTVLFDLLEISA